MPAPCFAAVSPAPRRRPSGPPLALLVREPEAPYSPRHPERTALYRLFDRHFDSYVHTHEERFERASGALRAVVPRTVEAYLDCGRLHGGFARLRCPQCAGEHLLAFSCQTRNFCPSCQAKRAALFAEKLRIGGCIRANFLRAPRISRGPVPSRGVGAPGPPERAP